MKHFIHILLCIEPRSWIMHQYLLDNSFDRVLCTTYIRGLSGHSKRLSSETLITDKFTAIHLCHVCCRVPNHLGPLAVVFLFWGNSIICTPLTNFLYYVLTGFEGEQTSSVRFMEWWAFSVLNESKYKLKVRNRLRNRGAVTQESLRNSSLGKISVFFLELKKNKSIAPFSVYVNLFCLQVSLWNA